MATTNKKTTATNDNMIPLQITITVYFIIASLKLLYTVKSAADSTENFLTS